MSVGHDEKDEDIVKRQIKSVGDDVVRLDGQAKHEKMLRDHRQLEI